MGTWPSTLNFRIVMLLAVCAKCSVFRIISVNSFISSFDGTLNVERGSALNLFETKPTLGMMEELKKVSLDPEYKDNPALKGFSSFNAMHYDLGVCCACSSVTEELPSTAKHQGKQPHCQPPCSR